MPRTVDEEIFEFAAEARLKRPKLADHDIAAQFIDSQGERLTPAIRQLAYRGLQNFLREKRAQERIDLKLLELDPMFFKRLNREPYIAPKAKRPPTSEEREAEKRRIDEIYEKGSQAMRKMELALGFYDKWHLPDGSPLGDANRNKLIAEATRERATADGHLKNATFYEALAGKLDEGQTVRAIPLDEAHRIRESVFIEQDEREAA
jgi:hypothetical protein